MTTAPTSTDASATSTADRHAALLAAYTELMTETGRRPGVRALRERAKTSTDAAADWLKTHAPERRPPEIPAESLEPLLVPLWAAAVDAATRLLQDEHEASLAAHLESERQALAAAERDAAHAQQQADRAAAAEKRAEQLAAEITTAKQEAAGALERAHKADQAATAASTRAQAAISAAEQAAAVAQAEARTLREALSAIRGTDV